MLEGVRKMKDFIFRLTKTSCSNLLVELVDACKHYVLKVNRLEVKLVTVKNMLTVFGQNITSEVVTMQHKVISTNLTKFTSYCKDVEIKDTWRNCKRCSKKFSRCTRGIECSLFKKIYSLSKTCTDLVSFPRPLM